MAGPAGKIRAKIVEGGFGGVKSVAKGLRTWRLESARERGRMLVLTKKRVDWDGIEAGGRGDRFQPRMPNW